MSWFATKDEMAHFDAFIVQRTIDLMPHVQITVKEIELSRLILSNQPTKETCSRVCNFTYNCDCPERSSKYCQVVTNSKNTYDRVDWRRQANLFSRAISAKGPIVEMIIGKKRVNNFLAMIVDLGNKNLGVLSRSDRDKFISSYGKFPDAEIEAITIQDMEDDPWNKFIKTRTKKEEHLLTC